MILYSLCTLDQISLKFEHCGLFLVLIIWHFKWIGIEWELKDLLFCKMSLQPFHLLNWYVYCDLAIHYHKSWVIWIRTQCKPRPWNTKKCIPLMLHSKIWYCLLRVYIESVHTQSYQTMRNEIWHGLMINTGEKTNEDKMVTATSDQWRTMISNALIKYECCMLLLNCSI